MVENKSNNIAAPTEENVSLEANANKMLNQSMINLEKKDSVDSLAEGESSPKVLKTESKRLEKETSKENEKKENKPVENRNQKDFQKIADRVNIAKANNRLMHPNFFETADRVNFEQQNSLANYRRNMTSAIKTEDWIVAVQNLVPAMGIEVTTFTINGRVRRMLKLEAISDNAPIYVPVNKAGANYHYLTNYIGQRVLLAMDRFERTNEQDDNGNNKYIALASISQAEELIGNVIYDEFQHDATKARNEDRVATITQVIASSDFNMVFINYQGLTIPMYERDFHYHSYRHPLKKDAKVGATIKFRITNITKTNYDNMDIVKRDKQRHYDTPSGTRYYIETTHLPFVENPDTRIKKLQQTKTSFLANIVRVSPIEGITVQIGPGWTVKGYLNNPEYKPTVADALQHTPVTVTINSLDFKHRSGQVYIIGFPRGLATPGIDSAMDR